MPKDALDFHRDWGTRLLEDADPVWSSPEYLRQLQELAVPTISNYGAKGEYVKSRFQNAIAHFAPGRVELFTNTGTEANNLLFTYAERAYQSRTKKTPRRVNLLHFDSPYGGSFGRIMDLVVYPDGKSPLNIPTPWIHPNQPLSKAELKALKLKEKAALDFIRKQVANEELEIGGIFLEPIAIKGRLGVYRTEFMLELRKLADKLQVPIFADEILSGGGRSGNFWGYQRYGSFIPDLVTFGKGLITSGIFRPAREEGMGFNFNIHQGPPTTTAAHPLALLQGLQVLNVIKERNLVENAAEMGEYFHELQIAKARSYFEENRKRYDMQIEVEKDDPQAVEYYRNLITRRENSWLEIKTVGLIGYGYSLTSSARGFGGRTLAPLTITPEIIDYVSNGIEVPKPD